MKIAYIFHGHFPDNRAAALFAAEESKSFLPHAEVELLVPTRKRTDVAAARKKFSLPDSLKAVPLWSLELLGVRFVEQFAFSVSLVTFSWSLFRYLKHTSVDWVVTVDYLPALAAAVRGKKVLLEVHDFPSLWNPLWRLALRHATLVMATNNWKKTALIKRFGLSEHKVFVERNGVHLLDPLKKEDARAQLGLPQDKKIAVYTGHLYPWKGADTLAEAASFIPEVEVYVVGGTEPFISRFKKTYEGTKNLHLVGYRPHEEMRLWQSAADVLVLPNSAKEEVSSHYTSPMKLFEYMAAGRAIVASRVSSITEIVDDTSAYLCNPDDPRDMAEVLLKVFVASEFRNARSLVGQYSWSERAHRVFETLSP